MVVARSYSTGAGTCIPSPLPRSLRESSGSQDFPRGRSGSAGMACFPLSLDGLGVLPPAGPAHRPPIGTCARSLIRKVDDGTCASRIFHHRSPGQPPVGSSNGGEPDGHTRPGRDLDRSRCRQGVPPRGGAQQRGDVLADRGVTNSEADLVKILDTSPRSPRSVSNAAAENTKGWPRPSSYSVTAAHEGCARNPAPCRRPRCARSRLARSRATPPLRLRRHRAPRPPDRAGVPLRRERSSPAPWCHRVAASAEPRRGASAEDDTDETRHQPRS